VLLASLWQHQQYSAFTNDWANRLEQASLRLSLLDLVAGGVIQLFASTDDTQVTFTQWVVGVVLVLANVAFAVAVVSRFWHSAKANFTTVMDNVDGQLNPRVTLATSAKDVFGALSPPSAIRQVSPRASSMASESASERDAEEMAPRASTVVIHALTPTQEVDDDELASNKDSPAAEKTEASPTEKKADV
jgi:hypothetical protein